MDQPIDLTLSIREIVSSMNDDKYQEFITEIARQMGAKDQRQITLLRESFDKMRSK